MSRFDRARWAGPVPNMTSGGMIRYQGVVLHQMQGTLNGTDAWFKNPQAQASAHFGIGKSGEIRQWVDTRDKAWAQSAGNPSWISIELEGWLGETMTPYQVESVALVYGWAVKTHGIPIQTTDRPAMQGLGWHGMATGSQWGNHPNCPGPLVVAQRNAVLVKVQKTLTPEAPVEQEFVPALAMEPIVSQLACPTGGVWLLARSGAVYALGGAPYAGGAHNQPYFVGRKAARLEPGVDGGSYRIVATSGERYNY